MQTKNLVVCTYNFNLRSKFTKHFRSIKKVNLLVIILVSFLLFSSISILSDFLQVINNSNSKANYVSDFKLDVNKLNEVALVIESERKSNNNSQINSFGSDGTIIKSDEITPNLTGALINIADINKDEKLSSEEISSLELMRLNQTIFKNELNLLGFTLKSMDCNINNYLIITQGKYSGTILYNGPFKFVDNKNKRYFGLELYI